MEGDTLVIHLDVGAVSTVGYKKDGENGRNWQRVGALPESGDPYLSHSSSHGLQIASKPTTY
jgi:hypothetical protein